MALYNVESPGGYQLTGLTIPGVDILGSKACYSFSRPWLFEDFDQLTFYEVSEEEYEGQLAIFHSGRYVYEVEECEFDMGEHNRLLEETKEEVRIMKERQKVAQEEMDKVEKELMGKWTREKAEGKVPMDKVEALLGGKLGHLSFLLIVSLTLFFIKSYQTINKKLNTHHPRSRNCHNRSTPQFQRLENPRQGRRCFGT